MTKRLRLLGTVFDRFVELLQCLPRLMPHGQQQTQGTVGRLQAAFDVHRRIRLDLQDGLELLLRLVQLTLVQLSRFLLPCSQ